MGSRRFAAAVACALGVSVCGAGTAIAAPVLRLTADGHARLVNDRFLPAKLGGPVPAKAAFTRTAARSARSSGGGVTVISRLRQLHKAHAITDSAYRHYLAQWGSALKTERRLRGTRAAELTAVIETLHGIAVARQMTASRLPVLFLTLERNVQWWTTGPLLSYGQRVEFAGSQLVWEYYPGQGIELQVLGTFGKADGLYTAGKAYTSQLVSLLKEIIPLAVRRAGGLAWEYYFHFDGGRPPWVSAMSQGTALEALTRAYRRTRDASYLQIAHQALPLFEAAPPAGVALRETHGARFLQYSFAPGTDIINAFLQSLIGLYDYAHTSHDAVARALFDAGSAEAAAELPGFDTGAWSLYQPGLEDDLSYHELVTGFVQELCRRTHAPIYCRTATNFANYLHTPPALTQLTTKAFAGSPFVLRFRLSKISHVGIVVAGKTRTALATSSSFPYGVHAFRVPALKRGTYTVRLAATDLAGNFNRVVGTLTVKPRPKPKRHR